MSRLSVLKYCCEVLAQRESTDPNLRWFWTIRRKVANYCRAYVEEREGPSGQQPPLTSQEKRHIETTHPLLEGREGSSHSAAQPSEEWIDELRKRVFAYVETLK